MFSRGFPARFFLRACLALAGLFGAVCSSASAAGCSNGRCCPGGVCTNPTDGPINITTPAPAYAAGPQAPVAADPATAVAPASSGIWPFSTGMMGGSFGPRRTKPAAPAQTPHPAVVRIVATDRDALSLGSGTLIYVTDKHGLVITNAHVVRDAVGPIEVIFPDGFRSQGTVIKADGTWDLAAIGIWRPSAAAVPLATSAPQAGEALTIAGYGGGPYRAVTGRRSAKMYTPGGNHPREWIEIEGAEARQGDSGGPIFNQRGELAGVLFGASPGFAWSPGQTIGSYCGRVGTFLADVTPVLDSQRSVEGQQMLANNTVAPATATMPPPEPVAEGWRNADAAMRFAGVAGPATGVREEPAPPMANYVREAGPPPRRNELLDTAQAEGRGPLRSPADRRAPSFSADPAVRAPLAAADRAGGAEKELRWEDFVGVTGAEQAKSLLAAIGVASILLFASKVMLGREAA